MAMVHSILKCLQALWRDPAIRWALIPLASVTLASCMVSQPDTSFLDDYPCAAPCWQGITPGVTDEHTALEILSNPALVEQDTLRGGPHSDDPSRSGYHFRRVGAGGGGIGFTDGLVDRIDLNLAGTVMLVEVVGSFGDPDFVRVEDTGQDRYCYGVDLFYVQKGVWIVAGTCRGRSSPYEVFDGLARVSPEIGVGGVRYGMPRETLKALLLDSLQFAPESVPRLVEQAQPWAGYDLYPMAP